MPETGEPAGDGNTANDKEECKGDRLPAGWIKTGLQNLVELKYGKGLKKSDRQEGASPVYGSNGIVGYHDSSISLGPTLIVGRKGSIGAVHWSIVACWPIDTTYYVDEFWGLDPAYVKFSLGHLKLARLDTSTAIPGLNRGDIYRQQVRVPPLTEQKRIVAKVEELLVLVRAARERLERVSEILAKIHKSILVEACSGNLTASWPERRAGNRSAHRLLESVRLERNRILRDGGRGEPNEPLHPTEDGQLHVPSEWAPASLDELTTLITSGSRGWARYYADSGSMFIRAQDINQDVLRREGVTHVQLPPKVEGRRTRVLRGDILITITGANVTRAALVDRAIGEAYVNQHVALVRPADQRLGGFLYLWIVSPLHGRAKLLSDAYGAGKPGLNLTNIRELPMAIPAHSEQVEILRLLNVLLHPIGRIEERVQRAKVQADDLEQAILAKAFAGELVPTEAELARAEGREYEPASVLLERIKEERESQKAAKKKSPKRARKRATSR